MGGGNIFAFCIDFIGLFGYNYCICENLRVVYYYVKVGFFMGKGTRSRENREVDVLAAANKKNTNGKKKDKTTLIISLAIILLVGVCLFATISNSIVNGGGAVRRVVSVETTNYDINNAMVTYFFGNIYQNYVNTYSSYLSYLGLDVNKSLKNQQYGSDGTTTWFDYIMDAALTQTKQTVLMCEAANEAGISLSDDELKSVSNYIKAMKQQANASGYTGLDGYLSAVFGKGVNEDVFRQCLEMELLSSKYYEKYDGELSYTDEQYEAFYSEHDTNFLYCDYKTYKFTVDADSSATTEEERAAIAKAKADAEALAAAKTPEEFDQLLRDYLIAELDEDKKEDKAELDAIDKKIENTLVELYAHNTTSDFAKWAFEDGRAANDTKVIEGDGYASVYMIVKPTYRNEDPTKNLRRIIIATSEYESKDAAKAKADEILAEFLAGDKTGEAFAEFAKEYSYDGSAAENGGLYENYAAGSSYGSKLDAWCNEDDRKIGDAAVVENATYGYEIVFYESDGIAEWKNVADQQLRAEDFEAKIEALAEQFEYTENKDKLYKIDA